MRRIRTFLQRLAERTLHFIASVRPEYALILAGCAFLFVLLLSFFGQFITDYLLNSWTELLSIFLSVFFIDRLRQREEKERYKNSLRRQARSRSKENAIDAIEIIREERWLNGDNALLKEQTLDHANLKGGDLSDANLIGSSLQHTYMQETVLKNAYLTAAKLCHSDMSFAMLDNAELINANLTKTKLIGTYFFGAKLFG